MPALQQTVSRVLAGPQAAPKTSARTSRTPFAQSVINLPIELSYFKKRDIFASQRGEPLIGQKPDILSLQGTVESQQKTSALGSCLAPGARAKTEAAVV